MGEERRNLACGLARSQNFFFRNPWREVLLVVACLLACSYYGERGVVIIIIIVIIRLLGYYLGYWEDRLFGYWVDTVT